MSLTKPQIDFLKRLAMRPRGEVVLAHSHQPERWIDLEQVGYVTAKRATKEGDLSMLFNITDAGRRVLAEQRPTPRGRPAAALGGFDAARPRA